MLALILIVMFAVIFLLAWQNKELEEEQARMKLWLRDSEQRLEAHKLETKLLFEGRYRHESDPRF